MQVRGESMKTGIWLLEVHFSFIFLLFFLNIIINNTNNTIAHLKVSVLFKNQVLIILAFYVYFAIISRMCTFFKQLLFSL